MKGPWSLHVPGSATPNTPPKLGIPRMGSGCRSAVTRELGRAETSGRFWRPVPACIASPRSFTTCRRVASVGSSRLPGPAEQLSFEVGCLVTAETIHGNYGDLNLILCLWDPIAISCEDTEKARGRHAWLEAKAANLVKRGLVTSSGMSSWPWRSSPGYASHRL